MNSIKVALFSHEFPPFLFGGIGSNCYDLAHSLSKKGVETTVFCGRPHKGISIEKVNENLEIVRLPFIDLPPRFFWFQLLNFGPFLKLIKNYTVLHAVDPQSGAICAYLKRRLRKPLITSIHSVMRSDLKVFLSAPFSEWTIGDFGYNILEYPLHEFLLRTCLANSDHVIVHGLTALNDMKAVYQNLNFKKVSMIYNGISFDKINEIGNEFTEVGSTSNGISITYFGRLFWRKGLLHLIKAFAIVEQEFPYLTLNIFGKGPLEQKVRKLILKLGLKSKIHLLGAVSYADLIKEVKTTDIVSLPSLYEVGPYIAPLEAMACKKPVIAFDLPFTREFIRTMKTGLLVEPGNVEDLAEKILLLLSDKQLRRRLGQCAYQYVKKNHNWDMLVDDYIKSYEDANARA